jgi:hypothetical protein
MIQCVGSTENHCKWSKHDWKSIWNSAWHYFLTVIITGMRLTITSRCIKWLWEEFEDTKGVIKIRKLKKNRQHNYPKKKDKQRSTKHTHKTKDRVTRTPLKIGSELRCSGRVSFVRQSSFPTDYRQSNSIKCASLLNILFSSRIRALSRIVFRWTI